MWTSPTVHKVLSSMSETEKRCYFPNTIQSQRTLKLLVVPTEIFVQGFCVPIQDKMKFHRILKHCFEVFKSGSHSFNNFLCWVNLMIHHNSLEFYTLFTQSQEGPQTIVHEHAPNCLTDGTVFQLFQMLSKC